MRLLLLLMWLMHWLPLPILGRIGDAIGALLYRLLKKRRQIALINLRLCLPNLSEAERIQIAQRHFQAYSRSVWERGVLWWSSEARLKKLIVVEPAVPMDTIQAGPTILLCPHFVGLDVAGVAVMMESSLCSIYTRQSNRVFDEAIRRGRSRFRPIKLFARSEGVKPIIRAMRDGLPFFMLPDMDFGAKDADFIPFFGIPAATLTAAPRIAAATGAKVVPVVATSLPNYQGWKVTFYPAWENYPGDDTLAAVRQMNAFIEARVLETPAEYFWTHKRFKTRPPGVPSVYMANPPNTLPLPMK
ncbi:MAG: lipid A biosynthesis acyltransferase [Pseudomonadota bacterium]